jgi:hypothetical protein
MLRFVLLVGMVWPLSAAEPLVQSLRESFQTMRMYLTATGESMPEAQYGFKITPVSRPFGEWMRHTAEMNYASCAKLRSVAPPDQQALVAAKSKAELLQELKASFSFCDPAFRGWTDRQLLTEAANGERRYYPVTEMLGLATSLHEHYGNLIAYLRANGITPPSTRRTQRVLE